MKQHDRDTFNELFAVQAKLQDHVNVYNVVASNGDPIHLNNTLLLMGGDPRPKLQEMNNYIDTCLKSFENRAEEQRSANAKNQVEINNLRKQADSMRASNLQKQKYIDDKKVEADTLNLKIIESEKIFENSRIELQKANEDNIDYIQSMSLKERSFVLQNALKMKADDVIKLMENVELDADFRNGDGVSLMQTAIEIGYEGIINKLKPLASEESYHPPKKVIENIVAIPKIETDPINIQKDKDIVDELVGQMNNANLHQVEEVKDDIKSTGEHPEHDF